MTNPAIPPLSPQARMASTLKPGDKVWYRGAWGTAEPQRATITGRGASNGNTVYDCRIEGETDPLRSDRWGYLHQFSIRNY